MLRGEDVFDPMGVWGEAQGHAGVHEGPVSRLCMRACDKGLEFGGGDCLETGFVEVCEVARSRQFIV